MSTTKNEILDKSSGNSVTRTNDNKSEVTQVSEGYDDVYYTGPAKGKTDITRSVKRGLRKANVSSPSVTTEVDKGIKKTAVDGTGATSDRDTEGLYEKLFKERNPDPARTKEELEKERKREKRAKIISAIGDGITALANLYFTTKGAPNMYTGKNTLSAATKARYDKLMKDREENSTAYFNGLMKAKQADAEEKHRERSWRQQVEKDAKADDRYKEEQEYKRQRDAKADEHWQKTFDEKQRASNRDYELKKNKIVADQAKATATRARVVRGKRIGFSDGANNEVAIYENVWKGSMQSVFDAIVEDLRPTADSEQARYNQIIRNLNTSQKKEDYVKQNWYKSSNAKRIMLALSGIDPANMKSEISEDIEEYEPEEEEIIDYIPENEK